MGYAGCPRSVGGGVGDACPKLSSPAPLSFSTLRAQPGRAHQRVKYGDRDTSERCSGESGCPGVWLRKEGAGGRDVTPLSRPLDRISTKGPLATCLLLERPVPS